MNCKSYIFRAERLADNDQLVLSHEIVVQAVSYKAAWVAAVEQLACDDVREIVEDIARGQHIDHVLTHCAETVGDLAAQRKFLFLLHCVTPFL